MAFGVFRLEDRADFCRPDRFFLFRFQAFHEPSKLLPGDGPELIFIAGPLELAVLQSFVQENEAIAFPQKSFDAIASFPAEDVQRRCERTHLKMILHQSGQAVDGLAHIGISAGDIYVLGNTDVA